MGYALPAVPGFFPLDEELALLPGSLTPHLQECLVRLGTWMPFGAAGELLRAFSGVTVTAATVRRQSEKAGAALAAVQDEEAARIKEEMPPAPRGPEKQLLSVDGAMVPLLHGQWAEVKTLVIGEIEEAVQERGEWAVHSGQLSYFSRLTDSKAFEWLALGETHRRGVENARQVCAVTDGADWEQSFIDLHRPDAVRILDFAHAAERISQMGQVVFGEGTPETMSWLTLQLHQLKHEGPAGVLAELRTLAQTHAGMSLLDENLAYLQKREAHMQYPSYQLQGLPIGSGAVESGNKLVVEARLKGAGMHWAQPHVNPMLALRNVVCNARWEEAWPQIVTSLRRQVAEQRRVRQRSHCATVPILPEPAPPSVPPDASVTPIPPLFSDAVSQPAPAAIAAGPKQPHRPAPDHPWRHSPIGRARYKPREPKPHAKT
jgi:hypothetical protein